MKIIDTNIIIRFLIKDGTQKQLKICETFFDNLENNKETVFLSEGVLMEALFVLTKFYEIDKEIVVDKLKKICLIPQLENPDKFLFLEALNIHLYKNIDFVDAIVLARAKFYDYEILSFDKKLLKLAG